MTSQKDFFICFLSCEGIFYLWSWKIYAFSVRFVMIAKIGEISFFLQLSQISVDFFSVWSSFLSVERCGTSKKWKFPTNSITTLICWIFLLQHLLLGRLDPCPDIREGNRKRNKKESWKMICTNRFGVFIMIALDVASLNPFLMSQNYWQSFFSQRFFLGAQQELQNGAQIIILNFPFNVLWNDSSYRAFPPFFPAFFFPQSFPLSLQCCFFFVLNFCRRSNFAQFSRLKYWMT